MEREAGKARREVVSHRRDPRPPGPCRQFIILICIPVTYDRGMRYGQRGGYTPAEQQRRERLRLEAAGRFARGDTIDGCLAATGLKIELW